MGKLLLLLFTINQPTDTNDGTLTWTLNSLTIAWNILLMLLSDHCNIYLIKLKLTQN